MLHCAGGQAGAQQPFSNGVAVEVRIAAQAQLTQQVDAILIGGNRLTGYDSATGDPRIAV